MKDGYEIARRVPVDKTAARVISQGPKGYESGKVITQTCQAAPPAMRKVPRDAPNLVGAVSGWLTVVGMSARRGGKCRPAGRWVCRCRCGYYVERTTKALRKGMERTSDYRDCVDKCDRCRHVVHLKRTSEWRQLGYHPDEVESGGQGAQE